MRTKIAMTILAIFVSSQAIAECSVEEKVQLAKAGYEKADIESLCAAPVNTSIPDQSNPVPASRTGIALLSQASIVGSNREDREKRRCVLDEAGAMFKSEVVPFKEMVAFTQKNINADKQTVFFGLKLRPVSRFGSVACNVMIVDNWRYKKDDITIFEDDVKKYQVEYEAILRELQSRGVKLKGAEGR